MCIDRTVPKKVLFLMFSFLFLFVVLCLLFDRPLLPQARFHEDRDDNFLEVNVGGLWGLVCFEMFNRSELNVICRDLSSRFGEGVRRVSTSYNNGTRYPHHIFSR